MDRGEMKSHLFSKASVGVLSTVVTLFVIGSELHAQTIPEVGYAVKYAADGVAKTHQQRIFVFGHLNCQLEVGICTAFETLLRDSLEKMAPDVHFIKREEVVRTLPTRGFVAPDLNVPAVLIPAASAAGAQVVVTDTLLWLRDGYEFSCEIIDAGTQKNLGQFNTKILRPVPNSDGTPLLFKDPDTGVSQLISRGNPSRSVDTWFPHCDKCPDPSYTPAAINDDIEGYVEMFATVTEQGVAKDISVIKALNDGLTEKAVEAVRNWRFKPAIGPDGKPIAVRVPIMVKFSLHPD